jgi:hypothetical protein
MAEQECNEVDDEKRARGGKRTSETKIAEVSTSKSKKRAKKAPAETAEPVKAQNIFDDPGRHSEEYMKRFRLERAAKDVADGKSRWKSWKSPSRRRHGPKHSSRRSRCFLQRSREADDRIFNGGLSTFGQGHRRPPKAHCRAYAQRKAPPVVNYPT